MAGQEPLIPKHGGYEKLKSFQVAQLVFDVTVRFCKKYIDRRSRTIDQMVQAARSGTQNIAEGSQMSGTSRKMEMKLTNVARSSLEELRRDYRDVLRQRRRPEWGRNDPRRAELIARRPKTADDVAQWAHDVKAGKCGQSGPNGQSGQKIEENHSEMSTESTGPPPTYLEIAANGALALIAVAHSLLGRQLAAQAKAFLQEGGFSERLYQARRQSRE